MFFIAIAISEQRLTPLGKFILDRRTALAMQQAELAQRIGVHATYLSTIETGGKSPSKIEFLERLANGLELSEAAKVELFVAARKSRRSIALPRTLSLSGYEAVDGFVDYIEGANDKQLEFVKVMLDGLQRLQIKDRSSVSKAIESREEIKM